MGIIQTLTFVPFINCNTVNFQIVFVVWSSDMLCNEVQPISDFCLFQICSYRFSIADSV